MRKSNLSSTMSILAAVVVLGTVVAVSGSQSSQSSDITRVYTEPLHQVIPLGGEVVKLNTRTGAMHLLFGKPDTTSTANTWQLRVPAVKEPHSGMLQLQRLTPSGVNGVFLVDFVDGSTWLLKWRGNQNGEWSPVRDHR